MSLKGLNLEKYYDWSDEKNRLLKESRDISFEDVVLALESEKLLDKIASPTSDNQLCYVVEINNYVYIVPFVEDDEKIFFKTIYPSRKHTKYYLKG
jgi:hypothetical protein